MFFIFQQLKLLRVEKQYLMKITNSLEENTPGVPEMTKRGKSF